MDTPVVDQPAPAIEISEWICGKPEKDNGFSGKNVVLEFWGTHCGPCITAIQHLNELVDTYGSESTLFVSLTHEESGIVERFLQKRPIKGAVAVDRDGMTFKAFGIRGIPHTFLIDSQGLLRWHGHPNLFTAELLETFLQTGQVPEIVKPSSPSETVPVTTPETLFFLKIDRNASDRRESGSSGGDKEFKAEFYGCREVSIIRSLLDHPQARIRIEGKEPEDLLDVELHSFYPMKAEAAKKRTVEVLGDMFGITIDRVREQCEGWMLTCSQSQLTDMSELGGGMSVRTSKEQLSASNLTIDQLAYFLESSMRQIFFNETHLEGKYDFELPLETMEQTRHVLYEEYGIQVESVTREIEMVVLRMGDVAIS
ncbi:MAG: TlpA family protein disulfide reductase [Anaerolineae bacterium]|jgi:thiol-disulfide isomerase/thioredoxin|nr:TlpA family protein disulfide reductase [Anaerolineae bacterium]